MISFVLVANFNWNHTAWKICKRLFNCFENYKNWLKTLSFLSFPPHFPVLFIQFWSVNVCKTGADPGVFLTGLLGWCCTIYDCMNLKYNLFVWSFVDWDHFRPCLHDTRSASDLGAKSSPPNPAIKDQLRDIKNEQRWRNIMTSIITGVV